MDKLVARIRGGKLVVEQKPCTANEILESGLMGLADIALEPEILRQIATGGGHGENVITPNWFARLYAAEPDFVLSILSFMRRRWKPNRPTKATRLFHFIADAGNYFVRPIPNRALRPILNCTDKEIAQAFENSSGGTSVSIDDVIHARRKVAHAVRRSLSFAHRLKLQPHPINYLHGPVLGNVPLKPQQTIRKSQSTRQ